MKLTEITINGSGTQRNIHLQRLSEGLNVVCGPTTTGTCLVRLLHQIMFGADSSPTQVPDSWSAATSGHIMLDSGGSHYCLTRSSHHTAEHPYGELTIADGHGTSLNHRTPDWLKSIDRQTWSRLFTVTIGPSDSPSVQSLVDLLIRQFDLESSLRLDDGNMPFAADMASFQTWRTASDSRVTRLESLRRELESLRAQRDKLVEETARLDNERRVRLSGIENELAGLQTSCDSLEVRVRSERSRLATLDHDINELVQYLEREELNVQHVPLSRPRTNYLALYYERLDEVENQIRRWRSVQGDIQDQRLRLKDELTSAGELNIESAAHPYHDAREIIDALENKVNRTDQLVRSWHQTASPALGTQEIARLCNEMRGDLKALCDELGQHYRHVRHRAAIAELKQLRRCYHEMEENVQRLLARRLEVIDDIRNLDPAGAVAIDRADHQFMICAEHEGYYLARERFVSEMPIHPDSETVEYRTVYPDLSMQRQQLAELRGRRPAIVESLQRLERELQSIDPRRIDLVRQRDELKRALVTDYEHRLQQIDQRRAALESELVSLENQVQQDRRWYDWKPDYLLTEASRYLSKLTDGRWSRIGVDSRKQVIVGAPSRSSESIQSIPDADHSLARLSLCLAAISQLGLRGIRLPLIVTDAMVDSNDHALFATLESFCRHGHQAILVTGSQTIAQIARHQGLAVYELADTEIVSPTWYPEPMMPRHDYPAPPVDSSWPAAGSFRNYDYSPAAPVKYTSVPTSTPRVQPLPRSEFPTAPINPVSRSERTVDIAAHVPVTSSVADRVIRLETRLSRIDLVESIYLTALESIGVRSVTQLIDLDLDERGRELAGRGFSVDQIERWQAQALLLVSIPEISPSHARVLVNCGITDPELLEDMEVSEVLDRIKRYLDSPSGRRCDAAYSDFSTSRIRDWADCLRSNSSWRSYRRPNNRSSERNGSFRRDRECDSAPNARNGSTPRDYDRPDRGDRSDQGDRSRNNSTPNGVMSGPMQKDDEANSDNRSGSDSRYKFFLQTTDDLEAAPSIGPRTAERFKDISIVTVADFLDADADEMASLLENRRMSGKVIRTWQNQTRMMCSVPNLRGHDAQILVACDVLDADALAAMDAKELFAKVNPFVKTKEGERIIRGSKQPDLAEIREWIDAAKHGRSLRAA